MIRAGAWAVVASLALAACDGGADQHTGGGGRGPIRAEAACDLDKLPQPLRQTLILVDERAIHKAADGIEFAKTDTAFRDLVLSIADPLKAVASGATAPRERVTIALVPADGSAAETTFTGCVPGLSAEELAAASRDQSAVSSAFSPSPAGQLQKDSEAFEQQLIGGMVAAAAKAGESGAESGAFADSHFLAGVRASGTLFDTPGRVGRIVLVIDLGNLTQVTPGDPGKSFAAGVELGRKTGGDLGRSELHIVLPAGGGSPDRAFLRGYFLAQNADLAAVAQGRFAPAGTPPTRLWFFSGEAAYPSGPQLVDIRIGQDGQNRLVGSWLTLLIDPHYPIPMTGQMLCSTADHCRITSDDGGFAQRWSGAPADVPWFDRDLPFGGMRSFALEIGGQRVTGKAFDDGMIVGPTGSSNSIAITGEAKH